MFLRCCTTTAWDVAVYFFECCSIIFDVVVHMFFDVAVYVFSMLQYMFFNVALHMFAMLQYLYPDVALQSFSICFAICTWSVSCSFGIGARWGTGAVGNGDRGAVWSGGQGQVPSISFYTRGRVGFVLFRVRGGWVSEAERRWDAQSHAEHPGARITKI